MESQEVVEVSHNSSKEEPAITTKDAIDAEQQGLEMGVLSKPLKDLPRGDKLDDKSKLKLYEQVFLTMKKRRLQRMLSGPTKQRGHFYLLAFVILLGIWLFSKVYEQSFRNPEGQGMEYTYVITMSLRNIVVAGVCFVGIIVISGLVPDHMFPFFCWIVIYWPLGLATARTFEVNQKYDWIFYIVFGIAEFLTIAFFVHVHFFYPKLISSDWFRNHISASRFWSITVVDDWTFEYSNSRFFSWPFCQPRYTCRYTGELDPETGLPHGRGVWSDNSYYGEVLTGLWNQGKPMAPFRSRQYGGKGNLFASQRIAFFHATDDPLTKNKFYPTNDNPARCGVVSIETSIAGDFYNHLPKMEFLSGFKTEDSIKHHFLEAKDRELTLRNLVGIKDNDDNGKMSIGECLEIAGKEREDETQSSSGLKVLKICCNDPRGVQISGHEFAITGNPFTKRVKQIVIGIEKVGTMDGIDEESVPLVTNHENVSEDLVDSPSDRNSKFEMNFDVKGWKQTSSKDTVVIFIPGYNSWLSSSLCAFGQMWSMMDMPSHIHPLLYEFPGGGVLSYRYAASISASENNRKNFLQMLQGLKRAGFRNVHIMTHSMGARTLMSAFEDIIQEDGSRYPSPVSNCFSAALASHDSQAHTRNSMADVGKLICRSITILNPDFPLMAFREHGFNSLRRVCSLITVLGDKADIALMTAMVWNGTCNALNIPIPTVYQSKATKEQSGFHFELSLGREIESLYVENCDRNDNDALKFQPSARADPSDNSLPSCANHTAINAANGDSSVQYLDCDCIDLGGFDANVNQLRHCSNINTVLIRDLEEIIMSQQRASQRSALLHRKGNVYQYCHAPHFMAPKKSK